MNQNSNLHKQETMGFKQQCPDCNGYGMVKTDVKICQICDGIKCMSCNSTGLEVMPYSDCSKCDRTGQIFSE
jgi:hypothetical protein